jgi:hypothetical protein
MSKYRPWEPRIRTEPLLNPFRPSTDWTRELGANDRIELADGKAAKPSADQEQEERKVA